MDKPYVIIHTFTTLDGKINADFGTASQQYQELAFGSKLKIDGYLNGRITTDDNTTHYRADNQAKMYYISVGPRGQLGWQGNIVDYGGVEAHVIETLKSSYGHE